MEQKSYGKPLFFSKLQMIPVKVEPVEEQKPEAGSSLPSAGSHRKKTK